MADAGLVGLDLVGTGPDAGVGSVLAAVGLDDQMVVGEQVGQVGVGFLQRDSTTSLPLALTVSMPFM